MPANFFKFKQFTIYQQHCAMKVCTDACLFGAYVADLVKTKSAGHILDIGAGTGLLSLLLAQRITAPIDAVEIDHSAYVQATENFTQSPWRERLSIFNDDILQFKTDKKYDCIISNPPFFENDLKSHNQQKNNAKHDNALTLLQLITVAKQLLNKDGILAVLLPYHRVHYFIDAAETNALYCIKKVLVKQSDKHDYFRGIVVLSNQPASLLEETIVIKPDNENYSHRFADLLKDYYLYL